MFTKANSFTDWQKFISIYSLVKMVLFNPHTTGKTNSHFYLHWSPMDPKNLSLWHKNESSYLIQFSHSNPDIFDCNVMVLSG